MSFSSLLRHLSPPNPLSFPSLRKLIHPQKKLCSLSLPLAASGLSLFPLYFVWKFMLVWLLRECGNWKENTVYSISITISSKLILIRLSGSAVHCFLRNQSEGNVKSGRKFQFDLLSSSAMDSQSINLLVLCGKSSAEIELAKSLKANNALKLPDNGEVSILFHPEIQKTEVESFQTDIFMNSLSTDTFGRLLIWSPQLPSTHDIVSQ